MNSEDKTKEQLADELEVLRKHLARLEEREKDYLHTNADLLEDQALYRSILEASPN